MKYFYFWFHFCYSYFYYAYIFVCINKFLVFLNIFFKLNNVKLTINVVRSPNFQMLLIISLYQATR